MKSKKEKQTTAMKQVNNRIKLWTRDRLVAKGITA
jgi:hypothetical protein